MKFHALTLAVFLSATSMAHAITRTATSANVADIQAKIDLASDGDKIVVPAGTATWKTTLEVDKNIILQGAGAASTVIINGITGNSTRPPLVSIKLDRNLPFRMSGFTFRGGVATKKDTNGEVRISGISHAFRIDHCTFDGLYGTSLSVMGFLWGVIDHCTFKCTEQTSSGPVEVYHKDWNGSDWGHGSWADLPYWGSEKFVFIEDNTFDFSEGTGGIDSFEGARFVVRYNHMHNCRLTMHGTEGQGRGAKQAEEYNNTYTFDRRPDIAGQIRSGCIITHDNTWTNVPKGHIFQDYRYYADHGTFWGIANGQNVYDLNDPNGSRGYWARGTHTGNDLAVAVHDDNPRKIWWDEAGVQHTGPWPTNRWAIPGAAYIIRNKTKEAAGDWHQSWILKNDSRTLRYSKTSFEKDPPLKFNKGDVYEIWKIDSLLDQPGVGKGLLMSGAGNYGTSAMSRPLAWPHQASEPCYSWNNTDADTGNELDLVSNQGSIAEGQDFFNRTPKPGYVPYTYPHPLTVTLNNN